MKHAVPSFTGKQHTARSLALQILLACEHGDAFVQEVLDRELVRAKLQAADRRLVTQLVYGVLRRRATLDAILRPVVSRQPHEVEPWLWDILRLGAYQLALLTHIPRHAVLHETVELAAGFGRPKAKGFINGVLRALLPLVTDDWTESPAAIALPFEAGKYRKLSRAVLPDPATEPVPYIAAAFSLPRWLVDRWYKRYGPDACYRLSFWFASPPPLWLRVNRLKTTREAFLLELSVARIRAEPGEHPDAVRLIDHAPIRDLPGYADGWFSVQDHSAMKVAATLAPSPGSRVLDMCSAPGGKTTYLAELMNNQGEIIACDVDERRLQTVRELCHRLGINIVQTHLLANGGHNPPVEGTNAFDFILVDVPCSNTGVLGRRPEARWRLSPNDFTRLVPLQTRLLTQAAERVRPGGAIVYSTCSIEPDENRQVVDNVLRAMPELVREAEAEQIPGNPADGGYWARLRRKAP